MRFWCGASFLSPPFLPKTVENGSIAQPSRGKPMSTTDKQSAGKPPAALECIDRGDYQQAAQQLGQAVAESRASHLHNGLDFARGIITSVPHPCLRSVSWIVDEAAVNTNPG
jgi:hypothetical protein